MDGGVFSISSIFDSDFKIDLSEHTCGLCRLNVRILFFRLLRIPVVLVQDMPFEVAPCPSQNVRCPSSFGFPNGIIFTPSQKVPSIIRSNQQNLPLLLCSLVLIRKLAIWLMHRSFHISASTQSSRTKNTKQVKNKMALRNYMLNLVSDCAETNETSVNKMCVTIVSDNTGPCLRGNMPSQTSKVGPKQSPARTIHRITSKRQRPPTPRSYRRFVLRSLSTANQINTRQGQPNRSST